MGILRHDLQDPYGRIIRIVPPGLRWGCPEFPDLLAIVADHCPPRHGKVLLAAGVGEREIDVGVTVDLVVLVAVNVGQEVDRMLSPVGIGHHRSRTNVLAIQR